MTRKQLQQLAKPELIEIILRQQALISQCNDDIGYISTAQAHREGGYEPTWSRPGPEAERQVVDGALELLRSLA